MYTKLRNRSEYLLNQSIHLSAKQLFEWYSANTDKKHTSNSCGVSTQKVEERFN